MHYPPSPAAIVDVPFVPNPLTVSHLSGAPIPKMSRHLTHILHPSSHDSHILDESTHHSRPLRFLGQVIDDGHFLHGPHHHSGSGRVGHGGRHRDLLAPDFDVRETPAAYFLEGEFPGVASREDVRLEWVDARTLAIDAKVAKLDISSEWGDSFKPAQAASLQTPQPSVGESGNAEMVDVTGTSGPPPPPSLQHKTEEGEGNEEVGESSTAGAAAVASVQKQGGIIPTASGTSEEQKNSQMREWLSERRIGHYQRTFTFPTEVDVAGVRAKLGQGLLRVLVPKMKVTEIKTKRVPVESVEGYDLGLRV